jgi:Uma2 family endonuclease
MSDHYGLDEHKFQALYRVLADIRQDPDLEGLTWEATPHGLVMMSGPDWEHSEIRKGLELRLTAAVPPGVTVNNDNAFLVGGGFERTPDLYVLERDKRAEHQSGHAVSTSGVWLFAEITSPSTRAVDISTEDIPHLGPGKVRLYADAGVPVYLVVDRKRAEVLVHSEPRDGRYGTVVTRKVGETIHLPEPLGLDLDTAFIKESLPPEGEPGNL